jgi:hypothetical protein
MRSFFDILRLYISSCSYADEPVRLYPTVLAYVNSALLLLLLPMRRCILRLFETHYCRLTVRCVSEVEV